LKHQPNKIKINVWRKEMKVKLSITTLLIIILAFILAGCNIPLFVPSVDVNDGAESTAAAQTVAAQLTQIAQSWTQTPQPTATQEIPTATNTPEPTNTPLPTNTPQPTFTPTATSVPVPCNAAQFIKDMTIADGTQMVPNTKFVKIWRLKNVGSCTWTTNYEITYDGGDKLSGATTAMPEKVYPGDTVDIIVDMKAPAETGKYKGYWVLRDDDGHKFGLGGPASNPFWVSIQVVGIGSPMAYDFAKNFCNATWKTDDNTLYCYGTSQGYSNYVKFTTSFQMESGKVEDEPAIIIKVANGERIRGIYPSYTVQAGDHFVSRIGCLYEDEDCKVNARLTYKEVGTTANGVLGEWLEKYNGNTTLVDVDLSTLVGKEIIFILDVEGKNTSQMFWFVPGIRNP
jgi:type II secretory pathway pseudopilin PulG